MGVLSDHPKNEPMHYGEVYGVWTYLYASQASVAMYQTVLNHSGDKELKELLKDAIKMCENQIKEVKTLLKKNGVGLPPTPPERPVAKLDEIPPGAKFLDNEIAGALAADIAAALVSCSTIIGQSLREDIAIMFAKFHSEVALLGGKNLRLSKEKGWIVPPPLHTDQD